MALMLSKTYEAFKEAGASDVSAREASEEIAGFEGRLVRLEVKLNMVLSGVIAILVGVTMLVVRSFA